MNGSVAAAAALLLAAASASAQIVTADECADASGEVAVPNHTGVVVAHPTISEIPTSTTVEGNPIAFNELNGVAVAALVKGVRITGNRIHSNGLLGINLQPLAGNDGATPNDPFDSDAGGNGLQNFPVLASAVAGPLSTRIAGSLHSSPTQTCIVEFFASPACDPSGHGEGAEFPGSRVVTTGATGNASFDLVLPVAVAPGAAITATATRADVGAASEFSGCIDAEDGYPCPADWDGDGDVNSSEISAFLTTWVQGGAPWADFNRDGQINSTDISDFLVARLVAIRLGC